MTLYHVWKYLSSLPAFAAIISQLVMMSVLKHCIWQKRSTADKAFFGLLKELFLQAFLLRRHTVNEQHYQALLSDWLLPAFRSNWPGLLQKGVIF